MLEDKQASNALLCMTYICRLGGLLVRVRNSLAEHSNIMPPSECQRKPWCTFRAAKIIGPTLTAQISNDDHTRTPVWFQGLQTIAPAGAA